MKVALPTLVASALVVLAVATTIARGGNDSYQSLTTSDLMAVKYVYAHVPKGRVVYVGMPNAYMPLLYKDVGLVREFNDLEVLPKKLHNDTTRLLRKRPLFILLSQSEADYGVQVLGYPPGWLNEIQTAMLNNGYRLVAGFSSAVVLEHTVTADHFHTPFHQPQVFS